MSEMICKRGEPVSEGPGEEGLAGRLKRKATQAKRGAAQAAAGVKIDFKALPPSDSHISKFEAALYEAAKALSRCNDPDGILGVKAWAGRELEQKGGDEQ